MHLSQPLKGKILTSRFLFFFNYYYFESRISIHKSYFVEISYKPVLLNLFVEWRLINHETELRYDFCIHFTLMSLIRENFNIILLT